MFQEPKESKHKIQGVTNLRLANEKLLKGFTALGVALCLRVHMRCTFTGRVKRESYWSNSPGCTRGANCPFCEKKFIDISESETAYEAGL